MTSVTEAPSLVWFRNDLRVSDNPALGAACARGPVLPVFIWAPEEEGEWSPGAASKWWLHHSLLSLTEDLRKLGLPLVLRVGPAEEVLVGLAKECGAKAVFWNRRYEPAVIERDTKVKELLRGRGFHTESFNSALLFEPWEIRTQLGTPYKVYTPFYRSCCNHDIPQPVPPPREVAVPSKVPTGVRIEELELLPKVDWTKGIAKTWKPGSKGALAELERFLHTSLDNYDSARDKPGERGTSRLSPHLHFGEISLREISAAVARVDRRSGRKGAETFRKELCWREFAYHLLFHFPDTPLEPLRPEFAKFPWKPSEENLRAWKKGMTGYPIVDAGMRELWHTGWMHNRVRMIVASFLVKDLLIPWQEGAKWFWDTLVDADLASNTLGWQWTAGCGADAAPFFRIFNPTTQGSKFDPEGEYIRAWCPELKGLPDKMIHCPWEASEAMLKNAGVELGVTYPKRIVDHAEARQEALEAYEEITSKKVVSDAAGKKRANLRRQQLMS